MRRQASCASLFSRQALRPGLALVVLALGLVPSGCGKRQSHSSNSSLRPIEAMIEAQLPPGTPRSRVIQFLGSRGHEIAAPTEPATVVAVIHHVDPQTLEPVTARVTFHFDAADKFTVYDLEALPEVLLRQ